MHQNLDKRRKFRKYIYYSWYYLIWYWLIFSTQILYIRPFDTISDFSISKPKWCPNHMDYKFKEFSGLAFLSLANRPSEVWPFFHFEFSLPLLWLVDSKFLRKYFSKILNWPIREEGGKIQITEKLDIQRPCAHSKLIKNQL